MEKKEANKLRAAIDEKNITIERLSEETGITTRHIYYIMNGEKNPTLPVAKKIAETLGKTIDELF